MAAALAVVIIFVSAAIAGCGGGSDETSTGGGSLATTGPTATGGGWDAGGSPPAPVAPGGESGGGATPRAQIGAAIEGVLTSGNPNDACDRFATTNYAETTFGGRAGCIESTIPASAADSVRVSAVVLSGNSATARVIPRGGPSSGETITVRLVREGGVWKVDSLRSNAPVGP